MELTLEQALKGKATSIKGKDYLSAEAYLTPFLERMSKFTNDFRVQGIMANQISLTPDEEVNMQDAVYNRMWVQAVMPSELCYENHDEVIGMVYGLDVRKPIVKIYRGELNRACTNLCVFDPSFLNVQELEPESAINFRCINSLMEQTSDIKATLDRLANTEVPYNEQSINENLGKWIRNSIDKSFSNKFGKAKLATSTAIDAYKLLYKKKDSPYYVNPGTSTDMFNVYNAWTQVLTDDTKDIISKPDKTILISDILELY
jgi:hypothetical protein